MLRAFRRSERLAPTGAPTPGRALSAPSLRSERDSFALKRQPGVSVVMIFWRARDFLAEAITSVRCQSYTDWELLLVDDGSDDGSLEIARAAARLEPARIRVIRHWTGRNRGMSQARNLGVSRARGELVTFLDADDVWLPTLLERQVAELAAHPEVSALCAPARWWYSWNGDAADRREDFTQSWDAALDAVAPPPELLAMVLANEWSSLCSVLLRRELFLALGGYEADFRGMYEDQAFHAKLCLEHPVYVSSACGYLYRQHADSCTRRSHESGQTKAAKERYLVWLRSYLAARNHDLDLLSGQAAPLREGTPRGRAVPARRRAEVS
jgi:glycosyltransferase involved in cell wall biosynthesis